MGTTGSHWIKVLRDRAGDPVTLLQAVAILMAGVAAGVINTVVGSGSLITFPTLLSLGIPPITANIANTIGLAPGSVSGAIGYRRELEGQSRRLVRLGAFSLLGALTGALLLLRLPPETFTAVVPIFLLVASALVAFQPRLAPLLTQRNVGAISWTPLLVAVYLSGVYGGYFSAAQGVILMGLLGIFVVDDLQRQNALKNALQALVNIVAALVFIASGDVAWAPAALIAAGSIAGGQIGARLGRRIPTNVLRVVIVIVGLVVGIQIFMQLLSRTE